MEKIKTKTSIFRVLSALFALMILPSNVICQSCYSPFIDSIVSQVSLQSITNHNLELTGEVPTVIGGQPYRITSRYWQNPSNQKAAQYIFREIPKLWAGNKIPDIQFYRCECYCQKNRC